MTLIARLIASVALVGAVGSVHALPITDIYTPATAVELQTGITYSFQHDLMAWGFNPLVDTLTNATLTLAISGAGGQSLTIALDAISNTDSLNTWNLAAGLAVNLAYLQNDGLLNVSLTKGGGSGSTFSFTSSTLFVDGSTEEPVGVPEPAMLTLLGMGLLGTRLTMRRRTAKA